MAPAHDREVSAGDTRRKRRVADRDRRRQGGERCEKSAEMAPAHDSDESAGTTRRKRRLADRDSRRPQDGERYEKGGTKLAPPSSDDDRSAKVYATVGEHVRKMLAVHAENKRIVNEFNRSLCEEGVLTVESTFGNCDDGSAESVEARRISLRVSQSIVSLSSFAGEKRIRVCSGFVMRWNDTVNGRVILTAATLVRSLDGDNNVIPDLTVHVLLPDGSIADGNISLVDFHHSIAVVEVTHNVKLVDAGTVKDIPDKGDVLALGRAYEGGKLMCSRGRIMYQTSTFGCSELLVSSCKISMAGAGGPLINYNGNVLGINFYEKDQTSYLSMAIISRILEHHQSFGKIIRPWLGLRYCALEAVSLGVLERIYRKFPDVEKGLYIFNVGEGSPADMAGLCIGDVIIGCGGNDLSTAPEWHKFGAMLLDTCKDHLETHGGDYAGENITVEIVIKQKRDGSTTTKTIFAELLKESQYYRWPATMPSYKARWINVTRW